MWLAACWSFGGGDEGGRYEEDRGGEGGGESGSQGEVRGGSSQAEGRGGDDEVSLFGVFWALGALTDWRDRDSRC